MLERDPKGGGLKTGSAAMSCFPALLVLLLPSAVLAQDIQVSAHLNRPVVALDQQFELTVEVSGSDANSTPQPPVPGLDRFASYVGSSTSTSMQFVNGKMSVSKTYTHHYIAGTVGKHTIPAVELRHNGKVYASTPVKLEITASPAAQKPGRSGRRQPGKPGAADNLDEVLFLKAFAEKKRVFQNEPVIVTYKIYTAVNVSNYGVSQLPNTAGFWTENFELPGRPPLYEGVVNGRQFKVADIKKVALFPQGPGKKTLDPMEIECEVQVPRQRRQRRDIFDNFLNDPFFDFGRTVRKKLRSNPVTIDVLPLPAESRPRDFAGAVGAYSIEATVDKASAKTNEAISFKVTIAGNGNIKILPKPVVSFPADFEVYDPKITETISRKGGEISGSRTFEYILIPRFPGNQTIKPVRFSYFDPARRTYKQIATNPIDITVARGEEQFATTRVGGSKEDVRFIGQDIRFIQTRLPEFKLRGSVLYKTVWFHLVLFLPLAALAGALGYRRHQDRLSSNVAYARSRKANQMAMKRLKKANQLLSKGGSKEFYSEIASALMGYVGDKLNVSSAGLMTDEVERILSERKVKQEVVTQFLECLQDCDFQRFAPGGTDNGEMRSFFDRAREAIVTLEREL